MKSTVKVTLVKSSVGEFEGKPYKSTKIFYEGDVVDTDKLRGVEILQMRSDNPNDIELFKVVPGIYEIEYSKVPGQNGQTKEVFRNCTYIVDKK
jgi:hypothetical protein